MPEDIVVFGAGGFGREVLDVIEAINAAADAPVWRTVGVIDDGPDEVQLTRLAARGIEHLGGFKELQGILDDCYYVVAIGAPATRERLATMMQAWGERAATLVHPRAVIGSQVSIGPGSVVCGGVQLSTNVRLGEHVHVNPGAVIGHDTSVEDFVSINPGAIVSGEVSLGRGCLIGAGAVILQGIHIAEDALVGASACVTRDVSVAVTMVGVPARTQVRRSPS